MKKLKSIALLLFLLVAQVALAQLTPQEEEEVIELICDPIDRVFNLECPYYQSFVSGSNYTVAIQEAMDDANSNAIGGVIVFPGNTTVEITEELTVYSNITFKSSHSIATIKCSDTYSGTRMIGLSARENVKFENIHFDANEKGLVVECFVANNTLSNKDLSFLNCGFENAKNNGEYGAAVLLRNGENIKFENCIFKNSNFGVFMDPHNMIKISTNIKIENCVFEDIESSAENATGIILQRTKNSQVSNCVFRRSNFGVKLEGRNSHIRIEDNTFENTLSKNPIRVLGNIETGATSAYSAHIWIVGNYIHIGRVDSIIDEMSELIRDPETGRVEGLGLINGEDASDSNYNAQYTGWRNERIGPSAIYLTCHNEDNLSDKNFHENVVIENNIAIGPDYGFFDGGSADLYSLKDIVRLKCNNNVARNSGDLGFSIERSVDAIVSNNTADRNNSFGIAFTHVRNSIISNNVCENNALRRDYIYNTAPYGGILLQGSTFNNLIEGNHLYSFSPIDVSLAVSISAPDTDYTLRNSPQEYYGIIIRGGEDAGAGTTSTTTPFKNKIGVNNYSGHKWGTIYTESTSTEINDNFAETTFPKNQDYPFGTWFRNSNLNNSALGWGVVHRYETKLATYWNGTTATIDIEPLANSTDIQDQDIIGIELNDGKVYWTIVNGNVINNEVTLTDFSAATGANITGGDVTTGRVVVLRWLTVTH